MGRGKDKLNGRDGDKTKTEDLYRALKGLEEGEVSEGEVQKTVKEATPEEISRAEQRLIDEGILDEKNIKDICKIHLESMGDSVEKTKSELEAGHPVHTLISEHEKILEFLDELDGLTGTMEKRDLKRGEKEKLGHVAEHLVEAESHHKREEDVLSPRLERKGVFGPPRVMRMDHEEFLPKKEKLLELSKDPNANKEEIVEISQELVFNMRDHIFKEDNILYPSALETLDRWEEMKEEADGIGYCCFTPEK